jgi:hypothetical protein
MVARTRNRKPTAAIVETSEVEIEEDELIGNTDPLDDLDTEIEDGSTETAPSDHTNAVASDETDLFDEDSSDNDDELDLDGDGLDDDDNGDEDSSDEDDSTGETDEEYMQRLLDALRQEMGVVMEARVLEHILGVADFVNDFRRRHLAE